ncbi:MAG: Eco57I restriction-modification methylase domain-containing protein [Candidatus Poribacteria bacterium]|nr:Eco57I restriction-modification methylase domain-containing protein [Candidatus Poribacteria bacterium]
MNKETIKSALSAIPTGDLLEKSKDLLATIGYRSERTLELSGTVDDFFQEFPPRNPNTKTEQEFRKHAESAQIIFQFTKDEIEDDPQQMTLLEPNSFDKGNIKSFLFCAVELKDNTYSRTKYAEFTREINKRLFAPTVILFRAGDRLTVAFADRRPDKTDEDRDVLGQVTLIKDIRLNNPHRAHLDILSELSLEECVKWIDEKQKPKNFDGLLSAWLAKLDTEELNKQFYRKLFAWYEWAIEVATFPTDENRTLEPAEHVIRLITRLLFIWFIKENGLVADESFNKAQIQDLLAENDFDNGDSYYRTVLQNLFFATLNTEIDKRKFSTVGYATNRDFSRYRYKDQMRDPDKLLELFSKIPFINGGLFDCLDSWEATGKESYRIDCFSDNQYHKLSIPNRLFFDAQQGLIPLLEHYKFTIEENTPIEQEVALDPELLGRVFENLLAAYNPETGATVRKQTGSYYTPRAIVDYMVEEALVATLSQKCDPTDGDTELWDERLHYLLDYAQAFDDANEWFDDAETDGIVRAISELKVLDPAVGSGAFPMGMLHKLTLALRRLDPDNTRWEQLQKERAIQRAEVAFDTQDDEARREELVEIDETFKRYRDSDFGRKLYLIQNSIFGVDIQPVACQIAKLRFFISLAIEQAPMQNTENFGIKPLPNLETRFIAANTLIGLKAQGTLTSNTAQDLEQELRNNREQHFHATTRQRKRACKQKDEELRAELATELKRFGMPADDAERIARWDPYDQNATADWFDSEWMFGITEGFDVVIGNPPYIQLQKEGGRLGKLYQDVGFKTFIRTGDIYCLFYEKANQLLKNNGHVCFITSNKWMRAGYGKKLRDYFVTLTQPIQLLDMGPDVFDATVDTNILLFQNTIVDNSTGFRAVSLGADFDKQTGSIARYLSDNGSTMEMPAKGEPWAILSSAELALKRKIEDIGKPLKDWDIKISFGIKTGCNEAFIIDEAKREELIDQDPKSAEIIKPLLRGKDIKRYHAQQGKFYILATGYDLDIPKKYPAIYNHLETLAKRMDSGIIKTKGKGLLNRDDQGENWWNLRACAYYSEFDKEKIVWQEMAKEGKFLIDKNKSGLTQNPFLWKAF